MGKKIHIKEPKRMAILDHDLSFEAAKAVDCSNCGDRFWYDPKTRVPGWSDLCDLCNNDFFREEEEKEESEYKVDL